MCIRDSNKVTKYRTWYVIILILIDASVPLFASIAGAYVQDKFGDGELAGPVITGPFFILWPELSMTVGVCQVRYTVGIENYATHNLDSNRVVGEMYATSYGYMEPRPVHTFVCRRLLASLLCCFMAHCCCTRYIFCLLYTSPSPRD